ncbi:MAG: DUF1302 domain-containing protein [Deltaproteobacteria bacterium]|nr:DUF1302 domain-containing protein [Deltaproteobacteria bacterium]
MVTKQKWFLSFCRPVFGALGVFLIISLVFESSAESFQFQSGEVQGSLDTTVSYGASWRVQSRDSDLIGIANGGNAFSVNSDDGNLNYDRGLVSNVFKITSELELNWHCFSSFVRGTAFYDFENERSTRDRTHLSGSARRLVGKRIDLLDAYVQGTFTLGNRPLRIRVGDQVVSWGESTFIQNSINSINPVNVAAIRLPGSELREALVPEGMVWASLGATENIALEAFYLYDWEETEIDPPGSYFSSNDFVGDGGSKVLLGWGDLPDRGTSLPEDTFYSVPRAHTKQASNQGQFGAALRVFVPALNETEFGFFFMNYHSRLPLISAVTGSAAGAFQAGTIANAATPIATAVLTHLAFNPGDIPGAVGAGTAAGVAAGAPAEASQAIAGTAATGGDVATVTRAYATDAYAKTARYRVKYPEDIKLVGFSFNTMLGGTGVALQGEVSYRWDAPLQADDIELLYATLGGFNANLAAFNQLGNYFGMFGKNIDGYIKRDVIQVQATGTKLFGPAFGADQFALVGEFGITHVQNMPGKSRLRLDGAGTFVSGNPILGPIAHPGKPVEDSSNFADATSYGYQLVCRLDFNNAVGAVNLSPRIAWRHDVRGNSPRPSGNFLEGRRAVTFGLTGTYQNSWSADVSYTNFFGVGRRNLINDRDFISFNVKYSF